MFTLRNFAFKKMTVAMMLAVEILGTALPALCKNDANNGNGNSGSNVWYHGPHGVAGQKKLASDPNFTALVNKKVLFLPVISGDPPFNQSQKCIGFIAVRVTGVEINQSGGVVESITCKIIRAIGPGTASTPINSGNATNDQALARLAPGPIKLTL